MPPCPDCGLAPPARDPPRRPRRGRSPRRRYAALIRFSFENWPAGHSFQPESLDHLRRWLQCRAGYYTSRVVDTSGLRPEQAIRAVAEAITWAGEHGFVRPAGARLKVVRPDAVAFDQLPPERAAALLDAVSEIVRAETGLSLDDARTEPSSPPTWREELMQRSAALA